MLFRKILVPLDGSQYSHISSDTAFSLASIADASLTGQHVVDPKLTKLFLAKEFAEELGYVLAETSQEKVFAALRRIGSVILEIFLVKAVKLRLKATTVLDQGNVVDEILTRASEHDLIVVGHRGEGQPRLPASRALGSVAERVATESPISVLICTQKLENIRQILVAYDGSEPARGALLAGEQLAKKLNCRFQAIIVVDSKDKTVESQELIEDGKLYVREKWTEDIFSIHEGLICNTLIDFARLTESLLVVGAYGYKNPAMNTLGRNSAALVRHATSSILLLKSCSVKADKTIETAGTEHRHSLLGNK